MPDTISTVLETIIKELPRAVTEPFKGNYLADYIRNEAKQVIFDNAPDAYKEYHFKGSAGQGRWVGSGNDEKDAWIAIFNPEITKGAKQGYYVVYGFPINSHFVRFGILQAFEEAKSKYKKHWREAINTHADLMRLKIPEYSKKFSKDRLSIKKLDGTNYYKDGFVYSKLYDIRNLPPEAELVDDLSTMLEAYENLHKKGGRNLDEKPISKIESLSPSESDEEEYQKPLVNRKIKRSPKTARLQKSERNRTKESHSEDPKRCIPKRNPGYAEEAKEAAGYQCEVSASHRSFKRAGDGKNYTEAHHLIPFEQYNHFAEKGLCVDRVFNIVSLCPTCHRMIHHGSKEDVAKLLEHLYQKRGEKLLKEYGCDLEMLLSFYIPRKSFLKQ